MVFGFAWFLYRKQWAIGAILLLLPLVIGYFIGVPGGAGLGVAIAIAAMAKSLVVQDAVTGIGKLKDAGGGADEELARAGGVSPAGGAVGGAILLVGLAGFAFAIPAGAGP